MTKVRMMVQFRTEDADSVKASLRASDCFEMIQGAEVLEMNAHSYCLGILDEADLQSVLDLDGVTGLFKD